EESKRLAVHITNSSCGEGPISDVGNGLPLSEVKLGLLMRLLGSLAVGNVLDRTVHLEGPPRRVFLHIALTMHRPHFATGTNDSVFHVRAQSSSKGFLGHSEYNFQIFGMNHFSYNR